MKSFSLVCQVHFLQVDFKFRFGLQKLRDSKSSTLLLCTPRAVKTVHAAAGREEEENKVKTAISGTSKAKGLPDTVIFQILDRVYLICILVYITTSSTDLIRNLICRFKKAYDSVSSLLYNTLKESSVPMKLVGMIKMCLYELVGLLDARLASLKRRYLHTEQHKHRINAHRHPCIEWDSNPRPQRSRERRQFMP
jgi:hypothetical protein